MMNYEMGLVSISFRDKSPSEIIEAVKDARLCCIEWGSDVHAPCDDLEKLKKLTLLQEKYGISCSSYGTYFRLGVNDVSELTKYINAAKILGTDIIRLWCGDKSPYKYLKNEKKLLFKACADAAEIARENNIKFCLECHNHTYTETKESALEIMEYVSSPWFCMYWQPNQFKSFDENIEYIRLLKKYVEHLHVFNWVEEKRFPLFEAKSDWHKYLMEFGTGKTVLLEFMHDNRIESLKTEAETLKEIVTSVNAKED